jgi:hypothetical protein
MSSAVVHNSPPLQRSKGNNITVVTTVEIILNRELETVVAAKIPGFAPTGFLG